VDGADGEQAAEAQLMKLGGVGVLAGLVDLVGGHQHRFSGGTEPRGDFEIERQQPFVGVDHEQEGIGHFQGDLHLFHSGSGDWIRGRFAAHQCDATGIHQGERSTAVFGFGADAIARDARLIMHDGDPPSHHPVEQGGFADIGTTHDSDEARHKAEDGGVGTAGEGQRKGGRPTSWVAFSHRGANLDLTMDLPAQSFPDFSLARLLKTVFEPESGERICILIDLPEPRRIKGFEFLRDDSLTVQRHAHDVFYQGLKAGVLSELGLRGGDLFAYAVTGGSNLDLPDAAWTPDGTEVSLVRDVYPNFDIILCISTYSATAPLTAFAKQIGFRGATLHGLNPIILSTGLAVDYNEVSGEAEKMRLAMTRADAFEIDFEVAGQRCTLKLLCDRQEAQKSHGLCRGKTPDVANLPAGEVYFVPTGAEGRFPMKYEDGTLGLMEVSGGRICKATLLSGAAATVDAHNQRLSEDPVTGEIGELGFGTQLLPPSGRDIQDEKIRGTLHVATGRSDHLGGHLTPDKFKVAKHATHDDILFSPTKTPEISVPQARMLRDGKVHVVIENYQPAAYLEQALAS
jgi:aminopeptidase